MRFIIVLLCCFLFPVSALAQVAQPEAPRVILDTTYRQPTGVTLTVGATLDLQTAVNKANPGDKIVIPAGQTFTVPSDGLLIPVKPNLSGKWITVASSLESLLPVQGTRVSPSDAVHMATLASANSSPTVFTQGAASFWRFVGIEFTVATTSMPDANSANTLNNSGIVRFGDPAETNLANVAHDFIIDRCYIHGRSNLNTLRGIGLNSGRTSIIDSYISDIHGIGSDSQAIAGWNGPGPFKIIDNYLEAAGENIMFGGADSKIVNLVPADIEIKRNTITKPLKWRVGDPLYAGYHWSAKNIVEIKNAQRMIVQGNTISNSWGDAQVGYAVLFKSVNQDGTAPWSVCQDVMFRDNIVSHAGGAVNIQGHDPDNGSGTTSRVAFVNNLFTDISAAKWNGEGTALKLNRAVAITFDHNTVVHDGNVITAYDTPKINGFAFTGNIVFNNLYGIKGDSTGSGNATLAAFFTSAIVTNNVIVGADPTVNPMNNSYPATIAAVGFIDTVSYQVASGSAYAGLGADNNVIALAMSVAPSSSGVVIPAAIAAQINAASLKANNSRLQYEADEAAYIALLYQTMLNLGLSPAQYGYVPVKDAAGNMTFMRLP